MSKRAPSTETATGVSFRRRTIQREGLTRNNARGLFPSEGRTTPVAFMSFAPATTSCALEVLTRSRRWHVPAIQSRSYVTTMLHRQLRHDVSDMDLDRALCGLKRVRDLLVAQSTSDQARHFMLAGCERAASATCRRPPGGANQRVAERRRHEDPALTHRIHGRQELLERGVPR